MLRFSLLTLVTAALWSQNVPQKGPDPPPDVDKALRARVIQFCELHKQGKFREAEEMVADDTKDYFYNSGKPRYVSYELKSITYNEDFTKATAMVVCEHFLPALGFQGKTVKMLTPFNWKLVNGQWMWYVMQDTMLVTPFGKMSATPQTGAPAAPPPPGSARPPMIPASVDQFFAMIKADKTTLSLKPGASDRVIISNGMPGLVAMDIEQQIPGVEAKLDATWYPAGGKAILTVHAGPDATSGVIAVRVKPIGPRIAVKVTVE